VTSWRSVNDALIEISGAESCESAVIERTLLSKNEKAMNPLSKIQVRTYGATGREILVLHGGPGAPGSASGLAKLLAEDFRVLEPLQRRSGTVKLTVDRHVEDLAEVAPLGAVLVGHSFGGMLALSYAAKYPDRVSRILLIGVGTYSESSRGELHNTLVTRLGDSGLKEVRRLQQELTNAKEPMIRDRIFRNLGGAFSIIESYELIDPNDAGLDPLPADAIGHDETWQDVIRLQNEGIEPARFASITCPVMLLHGDTDPHPGESTRNQLREQIPHLEYLELERCGHEPWREKFAKETFLATLRVWLNR
jgi:pimeloyl-ACP methyl ester carboxylesterase